MCNFGQHALSHKCLLCLMRHHCLKTKQENALHGSEKVMSKRVETLTITILSCLIHQGTQAEHTSVVLFAWCLAADCPTDKLLKSKEPSDTWCMEAEAGHPPNAMVLPSPLSQRLSLGSVVLVPVVLHTSRSPLGSSQVTAVPSISRLPQLK